MLSDRRTVWVTPGGGVDENESFEQALKRELYEELGIEFDGPYRHIYSRNKPFVKKSGEEFMSEERYYLVTLDNKTFSFDHMTAAEKRLTKAWKWWPIDEIQNSSELFFTDNLFEKMSNIVNGDIPTEVAEI